MRILAGVAAAGRDVIRSTYPSRSSRRAAPSRSWTPPPWACRRAWSCTRAKAASFWPLMTKGCSKWPSRPTAPSSWCPRSATSSRRTTPCFASMAAARRSTNGSASVGRLRPGADAGAGPGLCLPHHRGHRLEGAVAGDQRPDDRGPGHRPDSPPAPPGRQAPARHRAGTRRGRPAAPHLPHPGLGGLRPARRHRDPPLRRREHPGRPALAGHAGEPDPDGARGARDAAATGAEPARTDPPSASSRSRKIEPWPRPAIPKAWGARTPTARRSRQARKRGGHDHRPVHQHPRRGHAVRDDGRHRPGRDVHRGRRRLPELAAAAACSPGELCGRSRGGDRPLAAVSRTAFGRRRLPHCRGVPRRLVWPAADEPGAGIPWSRWA